jgi:hypothetical protein
VTFIIKSKAKPGKMKEVIAATAYTGVKREKEEET